jgi:hypothetical protein
LLDEVVAGSAWMKFMILSFFGTKFRWSLLVLQNSLKYGSCSSQVFFFMLTCRLVIDWQLRRKEMAKELAAVADGDAKKTD